MQRVVGSLVLLGAALLTSIYASTYRGVWIVHEESNLRRSVAHHPWSGHGTWGSFDRARAYLEDHEIRVFRTMLVNPPPQFCGTNLFYRWYFRVSEEDAARGERLIWRSERPTMTSLFSRESLSVDSYGEVAERPPSEFWQRLLRLRPEVAQGFAWSIAAVLISCGAVRARRRPRRRI